MADVQEPQQTLVKHAIRWALICAATSIVLTILLYAIDYTLMVQLKFALTFLLIYLGITIYGGIDYRKSVGGFLSYGKAFQHGFFLLAISGLIATIFGLVLYHVIDTELPQKLTDAAVDNTRAMMESFGAPEDKMDEALEKARVDTAARFTVIGQLKGYIWIVVVSAVMALITSLFVRKNQPVEM